MKNRCLAFWVVLSFQLSGHSLASESHVHGSAIITIVAQGRHIEVVLASPAANLVGFEHQVSTPEQQKIVESVNKKLSSEEHLFQFQGADCKADKVDVDLSAVGESPGHHKVDHAHHQEKSDASHSDITATYHYNCKKLKNLKTMTISLLDHFQGIHKLKAMWVTESQQGTDTLTKTSNTIHFDALL